MASPRKSRPGNKPHAGSKGASKRPANARQSEDTAPGDMQLPRDFAENLAWVLARIFADDRHADKALEALFTERSKEWDEADRRLTAEAIYSLLREWRLYWSLLGRPVPEIRLHTRGEARASDASYQPYLQVCQLWLLLNGFGKIKGTKLPTQEEVGRALERAGEQRATALSLPDWLDRLGVQAMGEEAWGEEMAAQLSPAPLILRANTLQNTRIELKNRLVEAEWNARLHPLAETALVIPAGGNVFRTDAFQEGCFEVQDAASQLVAPFTEAAPGMRVIDACAGAGGKTLHLAAIMEGKGTLLALDTDAHKLEALRQRARRAGAHNIETRTLEDTKTLKRLHGTADRVLLDVPCSGLGVLRRNPDIKWRLTSERLNELCALQARILDEYSLLTRPGGKLIYVTCSLLPQENEHQIATFLKAHPAFTLEAEKRISPAADDADGFYMARMVRSTES